MVLDKLLLRLEATFLEMARDRIDAYRELMKRVDTNTVFAHAFSALDEPAHTFPETIKLSAASYGVFDEGE